MTLRLQGTIARIFLLALVAMFVSGLLRADIVNTTGSAVEIAAPPSVIPHDLESDAIAPVFFERSLFLADDLAVDAMLPGTYTSSVPGFLSAGTFVNSYLLHSDKVGSGAAGVGFSGSIIFDERIIGVISHGNRLNLSSALNSPTTLYGTNVNRGWELSASEFFIISNDQTTLTFQSFNSTVADQLRILTSPFSVPEPGALPALGLVGLALTLRRKRRVPV